MLPLAQQSRAALYIYEQTGYGVIPSTGAPAIRVPLVSWTLAKDQPLTASNVVNSTRNPTRPFAEAPKVGGGFVIQLDPISAGFFTKWTFGTLTTTGPVSTIYTHVGKINAAGVPWLTIELVFFGVNVVWRAVNCKIGRQSFDVTPSGLLQLTFDAMGSDITRDVGGAPLDAAPFTPSSAVAFRAAAVSIAEAGVTFERASRFAMSFDNALEAVPTLFNGGVPYDIIEGIGRPTGTLTVLLANAAIHDKGDAGTESSLLSTFAATDGVSSIAYDFREIIYGAATPPASGGTGPVPTDFAWQAYLDDDAGGSAAIVTVKNTLASHAAIPA